MKPVIIHLSNDYPDPLLPNKTKAVINLVENTPQYRHVVYALNRVSAPCGLSSVPFGEDRTAIAYGALPKGLLWEFRLPQIARWIIADIKAKGIKPDLIEAHKFTIEGVMGLMLSKEFSCPLICDIQGGTDARLLKVKKALRETYKEIAHTSAAVFPYAPWPIPLFEELAGLSGAKCHLLPVMPQHDNMSAAPLVNEDRLISVFHLDSWPRKNVTGMFEALQILQKQGRIVKLDICGGGTPKRLLEIDHLISKYGLQNQVFMKGPIENGKLHDVLKKYAALAVPSKTETYGLVYPEALFAGVPVLLSKFQGISGYLDLADVGYGCNPFEAEDIAKGMLHVLENQKTLKENIEHMQKRGVFDMMKRHSILKTYTSVIDQVLAGRA